VTALAASREVPPNFLTQIQSGVFPKSALTDFSMSDCPDSPAEMKEMTETSSVSFVFIYGRL
jgi:hypothetical protein